MSEEHPYDPSGEPFGAEGDLSDINYDTEADAARFDYEDERADDELAVPLENEVTLSASAGEPVAPFTTAPGPRLPEGVEDPTLVHGGQEAEYWQQQSENGLCVPMSTVMVLNEFGIPATEFDAMVTAWANGWLDGEPGAWKGMSPEGAEELLKKYGIESHVETDQTLDDLLRYLEEDRGIICAVDSDELWYGAADDETVEDAGPDHAVVITEINEGETLVLPDGTETTGTVTLNDPGSPDGMAYKLPLETFVETWDDSQNKMVVTDVVPPPDTPDVTAQPAPGQGPCTMPVLLPEGCGCTPVLLDPVQAPTAPVIQAPADPTTAPAPSAPMDPGTAPIDSPVPPAGVPDSSASPVTPMVENAETGFREVATDVWVHVTKGQPVPTAADGSSLSPDQIFAETMTHTSDPSTLKFLEDAIARYHAAVSQLI
jgi:Peptidase_C39 like family